jgi:hypothetical protein
VQVHTYGVRGGQHLQQASLGAECEQEGVVDAVVFPTGLVAMSPLRHLWYVRPAPTLLFACWSYLEDGSF